jgi:pyruvate-formate lyase-activating enzyme
LTAKKVYTLLVELRCNSYCLYCGQREVDEALIRARARLGLATPETRYGATRGRYTLETAREAIARARADGFDELSLQGGEPTLFDPLPELVAEARRLGFSHVGVVTNGRRLRERAFAERLLEAGLDGITVSLVGADAERHDMVSAAPGAFAQLEEGMANVRAIVPRLARPVTVNCNLILSAATVTGLGAEPGVRERLGFALDQLAPALARAKEAARAAGVRLHATDVPQCLHPDLDGEEVDLLAARARVAEHHYQAAAYEYEGGRSPRAEAPACTACLLAPACPRVPREYLDDGGAAAMRALDEQALAARVHGALAALDPAAPDAVERVASLDGALAALGPLLDPSRSAGAIDPLRTRLAEAAGDLMMLAAQRRDGRAMVGALCVRLGLHPPRTFHADGWTWALLQLPEEELARLCGAARDARGARLELGPFAIALEGRRDGDAIALQRATPLIAPAATAHQRVMRALFLGVLAPPVVRARRVRVDARGLELDPGSGRFERAWSVRDAGAVRLVDPDQALDAARSAIE